MAEIQFIVERLNQPPFSKGLSLVTFDEKSAFELLSILNDVLSALDERHAVDLRDEQQEMTAALLRACWRCRKSFYKTEGCNHMTCASCRHDFCWLCSADYSNGLHAGPGRGCAQVFHLHRL